ncbi:ATP-dependent helicase [Methanocalculus sp.]|uniref:UvrD-helicase domain-containing protein n=1 Tax=Methanocalculus sp. TaxID=2004547 RepID=UPI0026336BB5|nr:ATP-dependent helicase [Methanocalculus sp.]MDG6250731.1 ATP-dependent helicase [Methanocalculus sp.]
MIQFPDFMTAVQGTLDRTITPDANRGQYDAIESALDRSLFIVAGPGSGKTMVMALRVLKLVYVDGIDPSTILVTTFTKKAAAELRSRILGWGDRLRGVFVENPVYANYWEILHSIDLNQIVTGTLDSISENILQEYREPGNPAPVIIEEFIANAMMVRYGLLDGGRFRNEDLKSYLQDLNGPWPRLNTGGMAEILIEIKDRVFHDQVDIDAFCASGADSGIGVACDAIQAYLEALEERLLYDYAKIEQVFYQKLVQQDLAEFTSKIRFVLVDEYQDTNLLQEQIYFALASYALQNQGSITVVGDDDQSIYRFRGATVDLFTHFPARIEDALGIRPELITLSKNYRSTQNIVEFVKQFVILDETFQEVRVADKPAIEHAREEMEVNYPILGMFRDDIDTLAQDLASFIKDVVHNGGVQISQSSAMDAIRVDADRGGSPADVCVLCSSPQEVKNNGEQRLPGLLRDYLQDPPHSINVFNPRGQNLGDIPDVQVLCGLMLTCIDPDHAIEDGMRTIPGEARNKFATWRAAAQTHIRQHTERHGGMTLAEFVRSWHKRTPRDAFLAKRELPLLDLAYKLITWISPMQHDVEGLVYLEVITRTITQSAVFASFGSEIIFDAKNPELEEKSIQDAMRGIFIPLATGAIDVNEDLLETIPSDRIPVMSIHQAKGLEYPLVIVDVGSDFKDRKSPAFKRFPSKGGKTCDMEDELRAFSSLQLPRRSGFDRAFDDLRRLYFVAFSRPHDVLLLIGLNSVKDGYYTRSRIHKTIPNVATGWDRHGTWNWGDGLPNIIHI